MNAMGPNLPAARQEYMEALVASLVDGEVLSDCTSDHLKQLGVNLMKGLEQKYRHVGEAMFQTRGCLDNLKTLYLEAEEEALTQFHARIQSATTSGHAVDAHVHRRAIQSCYTDLVRSIDIKNTTLSDEFVAQGIIDAADADSLTGIKSTKAANEAFLKRVCIMFAFEQFMDIFLPTLTPYVPESIEKKLRDLTDQEVSRSGLVVDRCPVCQVKAYVNPRDIADKLLEMTAILPNLHTDLKNPTLSSESRWARIIDVVKQPGQIVEALRNILPCPVFQEFDLERVDAFVCRCPTSGEESGMAVEMEAAEQTVPKSQLGERNSGTDNEDCHAHRIGVQRVHRLLVTSLQDKGSELFKMLVEINALKDCDVASLAAMSNGKMQAEATLRIVQNTLSFGEFVEKFLPVISTSCPESVYGDLLTSVWVSRANPHPITCNVCQTRDRTDPKRLADIFLETGSITVNVHSDLKTSGLSKEQKWDIICEKVPDDVILAALKEEYPGFFQDAHLADVTMFDCHCGNDTLTDTLTDIACMDDVESVGSASLTESPEEIDVDMKLVTEATRMRSDQHDTRIQEIFQLHCNKSSGKTETDGPLVSASSGQDDNCKKRTSSHASRGQDDNRNKRTSSDERTTFYWQKNRSTGSDRKAVITSIDDLDLYVYHDRNGFFTRFYKYLKDKWARLAGAGREQPRLFDFDAYLLYSEGRCDFVEKILGRDELSDFRFCVKDRDFEVGRPIAQNIFENIEKSRTVIVIRDKCIDIDPCEEYEESVVIGATVRYKTRVLNLVFDNATNPTRLQQLFKIGLTLSFPQSEDKQESFWKSVANFLHDDSLRSPYF